MQKLKYVPLLNRRCMRMRAKTVPFLSALRQSRMKALITSFTKPYSSQIIKSPSLVSLDLQETWASPPGQCNHSPVPEYGGKSTAETIDGKAIAEMIRSRIAREVRQMKDTVGHVPGLAVVLVGQRRDSETYVRKKIIASEEVGIKSTVTRLPENCSESEVCNALSKYNEDRSIHGILLQLPLPLHLNEARILNIINLEKDVDGFHPLNIGNLAMQGMEPLFIPCTARACIELLLHSNTDIMGKNAVVIGKSNIVGLPTSLLLQRHHATVTIVHALTGNPEKVTRGADILIAAAGIPNLVRGSWLKPGAVVIDVGTNPIEDEESELGYRLVGDVCFDEAKRVASAITPVPGGVGPMTVAMLLLNTLESAKRSFKLLFL